MRLCQPDLSAPLANTKHLTRTRGNACGLGFLDPRFPNPPFYPLGAVMVMVLAVRFHPPLAIARLGGADTPMDNYQWVEDPTIHGASRNVIEPRTTLEVLPDGSVWPFMPNVLRFREGTQLRPVAPFFELWATVEYDQGDPETHATTAPGATAVQPGSTADVPLTRELLLRAGGSLDAVVFSVDVANRKAMRRTGNASDSFEAGAKVNGNNHAVHRLLAYSPPKPGGEPLVLPQRPLPLGKFQVIRPVDALVGAVDLGVLRVRFTPARGEVYGPPTAVIGQDVSTGRFFEMVPPENRILNPQSTWLQYNADYATYTSPEPSDTYDGADQDAQLSWGVVDDTCDGVVSAEVVIAGHRFTSFARVCVGPPHYAPDRRPFLSLADDLSDRDLEPASEEELVSDESATQARLADLFQRVWEVADMVNLDAIRFRALIDNAYLSYGGSTRPLTDQGSMRPQDRPYADDDIEAKIPTEGFPPGLPFTGLVPEAHDQLAEEDELLSFFLNQAERLQQMVRPAYGKFAALDPAAGSDSEPNVAFRDPRITRDLMHDMRMPPYMRDEMGTALGLTRRQYEELIRYVEYLQRASTDGAGSTEANTPVRRRVNARLSRITADTVTPDELG
jgi:hypothetical protein